MRHGSLPEKVRGSSDDKGEAVEKLAESSTSAVENGRHRTNGRFAPGNAVARGRRGRHVELRQALAASVTASDVVEVVRALLMRAKRGDHRAAEVLFARLWGRTRVEDAAPVEVRDLPSVTGPTTAAGLIGELLRRVGAGELSADVAARLAAVARPLFSHDVPQDADWSGNDLDATFL